MATLTQFFQKNIFWNIYIYLTDDSWVNAFLSHWGKSFRKGEVIASSSAVVLCWPHHMQETCKLIFLFVLWRYSFSFVNILYAFLGKNAIWIICLVSKEMSFLILAINIPFRHSFLSNWAWCNFVSCFRHSIVGLRVRVCSWIELVFCFILVYHFSSLLLTAFMHFFPPVPALMLLGICLQKWQEI